MIEDKEFAETVVKELLVMSERINELIFAAQDYCEEKEYQEFKDQMAKILAEIYLAGIVQIARNHPELDAGSKDFNPSILDSLNRKN